MLIMKSQEESKDNKLTFRVKDKVLGEEISVDNINLPLLNEFSGQVMTFIRGSKRIDLKTVKAAVKTGSLVFEVGNETGLLDEAFTDYERAFKFGNVNSLDPVRAGVIETWQQEAKSNPYRVYELIRGAFDTTGEVEKIVIDEDTDFKQATEIWVPVEKYVYGRIYDLGGKKSANVHLELLGHGTLTISAEVAKLTEEKTNRLYQNQLVRIKAEQNIKTQSLRNERLVAFEKYQPHFDEDEFDAFVRKGKRAWSSIKDSNGWLEELRGNV